tara:strand:- start:5 stop:748 length:744 start_codon:yes stop_codon:yes gene_type:complete
MTFPFLSKRLPSNIAFDCTVIGKTDSPSYEGSSHNHQSLCSPTAHNTIWSSEWAESLTKDERSRLNLRMQNYDYYDCGYQLYSTHRGAYVLVPKAHDADVWLFTPQEYTPVKPKAPYSMVCTTSGCNHGHITWNGSTYPCSECDDIAKFKRDLAAYVAQVSENPIKNKISLPKAFEPFQYMYHYNIIGESSPIWQKLNPIIVMMDDYEEKLQSIESHFYANNDMIDNLRMMEHDILQEVNTFLADTK